MCQKWDTLKEITNNRLEKLDIAKEIHSFDRSVEETQTWILEKEAVLTFCEEDIGKDLASVHSLARQHEVFEVCNFNVKKYVKHCIFIAP